MIHLLELLETNTLLSIMKKILQNALISLFYFLLPSKPMRINSFGWSPVKEILAPTSISFYSKTCQNLPLNESIQQIAKLKMM
jgi:hypothetical protein